MGKVLLFWLVLIILQNVVSSDEGDIFSVMDVLIAQVEGLQSRVYELESARNVYDLSENPDVQTFGTAIKAGMFDRDYEQELFFTLGCGHTTHLWFTGRGYESILRIYIDGETEPSIKTTPSRLVGVGFNDTTSPRESFRQGVGANGGAYWTTTRIPFTKSIRITGQSVNSNPGHLHTFFFIVRGITGVDRVRVGDFLLPRGARLRQYRTEDVKLEALDYVTLANATGSGLLYAIYLEAESLDFFLYLESCFRAYIDGSKEPLFLSSGTEDYFNSAFYFNAGPFYGPNSGMTHKDEARHGISAYRFHEQDPVLFSKSFRLLYRNSESPLDCPCKWPWPAADNRQQSPHAAPPFAEMKVIAGYAWVYEW